MNYPKMEDLERVLSFYRREYEKYAEHQEEIENHYVIKAGELELTGEITITEGSADTALSEQLDKAHAARKNFLLKKIIDTQIYIKEISNDQNYSS